LEKERQQREKLLEIELEKRSVELEKAQLKLIQAEKSGLARNMAKKVVHEASNPLNVIKNFLNILKLQKEAGKIETDTIDTISREIDRVSRIIRQLTDLSRSDQIESGGRAADVREVLGQLLPIMEPVARQKGIRIETDIAPDLPSAAISPDKLKQLLMNLMKNAIEALSASPAEEDREGLVSIRASKTDSGKIFIEVADNGPGIPEELRDRIFDPFVTTKEEENSGLGLAICLGIVEAAGGEIKLDEREGFGAVFRILLPSSEKSSPEGGK
jgi:signal transduction histidine kinase